MSILRPPKTFTDTQSGRASWGRAVSVSVDQLINRFSEYLPLVGGTLTGDLNVPDEVYGVGWNGSLEVPTKNAIYDKIETIAGGGVSDGDKGDIVVSGSGAVWSFDTGVVTAFAKTFLDDANAGAVRTTLGLATIASSGSATDLSAGTVPAARMPALTGDVTTSAGAVTTTLAASGVSAASYTYASVTFDAKGRATAASSGTAPAMVLISEQSPSGTGTVTFSSIAGTYRDLRLVVRGRGTTVAASVAVNIRFNGDSGANYDRIDWELHSAAGAVGELLASTSTTIGYLAAASATANVADGIEGIVFDYRGTTFQKAASAKSTLKTNTTSGNVYTMTSSCWWRSTAAITQIDVILAAGNFTAGSVVSLYGLL